MGTGKIIFVGEQWGATGSHVTGTDITGRHVTGTDVTGSQVTEQHWLYLITWVDIVTSPTYSFANDKFK
jgi:hypothetical protein